MTSEEPKLSDITDNLISEFDLNYLPSNIKVLSRLLYETQIKKSKLSDAAVTVIKDVQKVWENSSITVKRNDKCGEKLIKLYESYAAVRKFQDRKTKKVIDFLKNLNNIFDISQDDRIKMLGSMDGSARENFLLNPVDVIKIKLTIPEIQKLSDEDTETPEIEMNDQSSPPKVAEQTEDSNFLSQSSPPKLIEPLDLEIVDQSVSQKLIEPDDNLSEKFSQHAVIGDDGANDDANIVSNIVTRSKAVIFRLQQNSSEESYSSSHSQGSSGINYTVVGRNYESKNVRGTINVMTPEVVAAFDKARVSDRDAVFITALVAKAMKIELDTLILNRTSINVARAEIRKREHERMKLLLKEISVDFLIVHWDGKMISDGISCKKVDRLPILVSSDKFTKILNVPALHDQRASTIASAIYAALKDWGLLKMVQALCCDTTNANLGAKGGAALLLEQLMDEDLLYLACRRHMLEILLRAGYEQKFPGTSGPDVPLFKRFKEQWSDFDLNSFENGLDDLDLSLKNEVPSVISRIKAFLKDQQPRDDYKELLEISLIFLGVKEGITFKKPGAIHHARWMAKAIYSIKIYLFRKAFKLKKTDETKLYAVCKFIVFRYLNPWYTASLAIPAPNNDLNLIKSLIDFQDIDKGISDAVLHKLRNHLWYLSPELSILSLFDIEVDTTTKEKIVKSLEKPPLDEEIGSTKKFDPSDEGIRALGDKSLDYLTNSESLRFFTRFKLDTSFLKLKCSEWDQDPSYIESREKLKKLVVVNDCAERAVHLVEEYIHTRSQDEDQKQYLIQFVNESRQNLLASSEKKKLLKRLKTE